MHTHSLTNREKESRYLEFFLREYQKCNNCVIPGKIEPTCVILFVKPAPAYAVSSVIRHVLSVPEYYKCMILLRNTVLFYKK